MPNTHSTLTGLFTDIASAIREKDGSSSGIVADAFPSAIRAIPTGGGADYDAEDGIVRRTISTYENSRVTSIGSNAFAYCVSLTTVSFPVCTTTSSAAFAFCSSLTTVSFPVCTTIGSYTFSRCSNLTTISFPVCTTIGSNAFSQCSNLTTASFPACTSIGSNAFAYCTSLTTASFPACTSIGGSAFRECYRLLSLYLYGSSICGLQSSNAFSSSPIAGRTSATSGVYGSIFVPMSLLSAYQTSTNWTYFSDRFVGVNPEDM